jgi:hypothetical protein
LPLLFALISNPSFARKKSNALLSSNEVFVLLNHLHSLFRDWKGPLTQNLFLLTHKEQSPKILPNISIVKTSAKISIAVQRRHDNVPKRLDKKVHTWLLFVLTEALLYSPPFAPLSLV